MRGISLRKPSFTLIELLLVVGIMGALSAIVITAVNPRKQLTVATGTGKSVGAKALQSAMNQYLIDTGGFPNASKLAEATSEPLALPICVDGTTVDSRCIVAAALIPQYLKNIPRDEADPCTYSSGYEAYLANGRVYVQPMFPDAMQGDLTSDLCTHQIAFEGDMGTNFMEGGNWLGGAVPGAYDIVTIGAGKVAVLDGDTDSTAMAQLLADGSPLEIYLKSLTVGGQLTVRNATIYVSNGWTGNITLDTDGHIYGTQNSSMSFASSSRMSSAMSSSRSSAFSSSSRSSAFSSSSRSSAFSSSSVAYCASDPWCPVGYYCDLSGGTGIGVCVLSTSSRSSSSSSSYRSSSSFRSSSSSSHS